MHSSFGFNFGNKFYSLSDKNRNLKRIQLKNLKAVIIDEFSMIKSDTQYQLDLRLREVTQKPSMLFGGVGVFIMGDIMQLRPCQGTYIFDKPMCNDYLAAFMLKTHWHSFEVIILEENHRQGSDKAYADMLNRIRVGEQSSEDLSTLRTRVRPEGHVDFEGATYISCTNVSVNRLNEKRLMEMNAPMITVEAINVHPTIKDFQPKVEAKGTVGTTAFLQELKIKVGARVMCIHNIDVSDCLTNGTRGDLVSIEKDSKGMPYRLMVKFDEEVQGAQRRQNYPKMAKRFPGCTPIEKILFQYSLSKKNTRGMNTAQVFQFPIVVCFAATTHKFQGGTIVKPNKCALDLRTVFDDAMAYVMLSRVQNISQLFILGSLPDKCFRTNEKCLSELERMTNISINKNPPVWEKTYDWSLKIALLNCHSILDKIEHIKLDTALWFADVVCLSETWLKDDSLDERLSQEGFNMTVNSYGGKRGKGILTYYKLCMFSPKTDIKEEDLQITMLSSNTTDIISVYRSSTNKTLVTHLKHLIHPEKKVVICGDFNFCYIENRGSSILQFLRQDGFYQFVPHATHIEGGHLDQVYYRDRSAATTVDVQLYSPYYTAMDHDALYVTIRNTGERKKYI